MKKLLFAFVICTGLCFASCGNGTVTPVSDNDSIDTAITDTVDTLCDTITVDSTVCND